MLCGIFLVLVRTMSLDGEHKVVVGKGTVRDLSLPMASLSGLCACFCARLDDFGSPVKPSYSSSKMLPSLLPPSERRHSLSPLMQEGDANLGLNQGWEHSHCSHSDCRHNLTCLSSLCPASSMPSSGTQRCWSLKPPRSVTW